MTTGVQISALPVDPALTGGELVPLVIVGTITAITQAVNAVITINTPTPVNPFTAGMAVSFAGVGGMTQLNGQGAAISAAGGTSGNWTLTIPVNSTGYGAFTAGGIVTATAVATLSAMRLSGGQPYNPTFQSGNVQYAGPGGVLAGDNNLIFGLDLPNPSGVNGACLLLGSGGGAGANITFALIQDQAFDNITPGNRLIITSGETQPAGIAVGGDFNQYAGASFGGMGGQWTAQGGTSANAAGGPTILKGGAATGPTGAAIPGDLFLEGGDEGQQGANVHLIMTGLAGLWGVIRHRANSTLIWDEFHDGSWFFYASAALPGGGYGNAGAPAISNGIGAPVGWATDTLHLTVPLAKLTPGGVNGSITYVRGIPQASTYAAPT
jgi:hypothetical protein